GQLVERFTVVGVRAQVPAGAVAHRQHRDGVADEVVGAVAAEPVTADLDHNRQVESDGAALPLVQGHRQGDLDGRAVDFECARRTTGDVADLDRLVARTGAVEVVPQPQVDLGQRAGRQVGERDALVPGPGAAGRVAGQVQGVRRVARRAGGVGRGRVDRPVE